MDVKVAVKASATVNITVNAKVTVKFSIAATVEANGGSQYAAHMNVIVNLSAFKM